MLSLARMLAATAAALAINATAAGAEPLAATELRALIAGKRVLLSTPFGVDLPLRYHGNGTVSGDLSGISVARMLAPRESGKWWIANDRLCQKWPSWYGGKAICFTVSRTGDRTLSWRRDNGETGTARIEGREGWSGDYHSIARCWHTLL